MIVLNLALNTINYTWVVDGPRVELFGVDKDNAEEWQVQVESLPIPLRDFDPKVAEDSR